MCCYICKMHAKKLQKQANKPISDMPIQLSGHLFFKVHTKKINIIIFDAW